jgi:SAM-dependent methyltransferase
MGRKIREKAPEEEYSFPGLHRKVLAIFDGLPRGLVLEAAAGTGILARRLTDMGYRVVSTDIEAKENLQAGLNFFLSDLNGDFAVKSGAFDLCACLETIEHLENPWHFVRELARVLRPGGRLILSTPNIDYLTCKLCFLLRGNFYPFFGDWQYRVIGHITPLSKYYLKRILEKCGFRIEAVTYNRYRVPFFKIGSPVKTALFGEGLIVLAVRSGTPGPA